MLPYRTFLRLAGAASFAWAIFAMAGFALAVFAPAIGSGSPGVQHVFRPAVAASAALPDLGPLPPSLPGEVGSSEISQTIVATPEVTAPSRPPVRRTIYLQPLGLDWRPEDTDVVAHAVLALFDVEVRALPALPLPPEAWYAPRQRYRAEKILASLERQLPQDALAVLGMTREDVSTTRGESSDYGVIGLASYDVPTGVVSNFRTRRFVSEGQSRDRLAKVAVHEIGHTFGLRHCADPRCLMQDAGGRVAAIDGGVDMCTDCRDRLVTSDRLSAAFDPGPDPASHPVSQPVAAQTSGNPLAEAGTGPGGAADTRISARGAP